MRISDWSSYVCSSDLNVRGGWLVAQALDCFFLFSIVFRLDGELDYAALAVTADDLGFYFFAFFQNVARVFNEVTADFGGFQSRFNIVGQRSDERRVGKACGCTCCSRWSLYL